MSEKLVHLQPTICIQQTLPILTSFQLQECFEVIALCVASIYLTICIAIDTKFATSHPVFLYSCADNYGGQHLRTGFPLSQAI